MLSAAILAQVCFPHIQREVLKTAALRRSCGAELLVMPQGPRLPTSCRASQLLLAVCGNDECCSWTDSEWVKVAPGKWLERGRLGTFRPGARLVCTTHCGVSFLRPAPKTSLEFLKRFDLRWMRAHARVLRKTKRKAAAEAAAAMAAAAP